MVGRIEMITLITHLSIDTNEYTMIYSDFRMSFD